MQANQTLRKTGLFLITILFLQTTYSQENWQHGYILKQDGDTVHGQIDYRDWEKNPDKIQFKAQMDGETQSFTALDIRKFGVLSERYTGAIVQSEVSPSGTASLQYDPALQIKVDTTFLKVLFEGPKSLYYNKNSVGNDNFYIRQDADFELLAYKKYLKSREGESAITENKRYIGQLTLYLDNCPAIQSKLNSTRYNQKSLVRTFQHYYACIPSEIVFEYKPEKISTEIGAIAGATISLLKFTGDNDVNAHLTRVDFGTSVNFTAGLYFDVILPRNQGKWSINNEMTVTTYKFEGMYEKYKNENEWTKTYTNISYTYFKINNMLRYKHLVGRAFIYANAGISNGFAISVTNDKTMESKFYSTEKTDKGKALDETKEWEMGLLFGLGAKYKQFSFEIRYERGNGMSAYSNLNSPTQRYYFLLGYGF